MATLGNDALTTVANLQEKLRIGSVQSDRLTNIINRVTDRVEHLTERKLLARNYDDSTVHVGTSIAAEKELFYNWEDFIAYDSDNRGGLNNNNFAYGSYIHDFTNYRLHNREYPIQTGGANDITFTLEVLESRDSVSGEVWATPLVENDDYIFEEKEDGVITFIRHPTLNVQLSGNGVRQFRVKGTFGFNAIPDQLEELVLELCVEMYRDSQNLSSERLDSWARTYDVTKENPAIVAALGQYTRHDF